MLIDEFSKLTGFYPTVSMYETIEKAYMESKMDKKEFCEAYKNNLDGMAEAISYWALVAQIAKENELIREKKELTERIKQLEKEVHRLRSGRLLRRFNRREWNAKHVSKRFARR